MSDAQSALPIDRATRHRMNKRARKPENPAELQALREETFSVLIATGTSVSDAYTKAGFSNGRRFEQQSLYRDAQSLYESPSVKRRVKEILDLQSASAPVTLGEVTHMLRRIYREAIADKEYQAAHNSAFSLAKLHGLVVDKVAVDIRRPSRDPDAPAELAIDSWISQLDGGSIEHRSATSDITSNASDITLSASGNITLSAEGDMSSASDITSDYLEPGSDYGNDPGSPGIGAPIAPVTGTPSTQTHSEPETPDPHLCKNASVGPLFQNTGPPPGAKNEPETSLPAKRKRHHRFYVTTPLDADGRRIRPPDKRFKENKSPEMKARSTSDPTGSRLPKDGKHNRKVRIVELKDPDYPF